MGDPSGISWETLGALWSIQNRPNLQKLKIVLTGVTKRVSRRLAGSILNVILGDFLDVIQQFGIINGLREGEHGRTRKDQGSERGRARKNILHDFLNQIQQLLTRNGVRRTWKEQGRSAIAMKQGRTRK